MRQPYRVYIVSVSDETCGLLLHLERLRIAVQLSFLFLEACMSLWEMEGSLSWGDPPEMLGK